MAEMIASKVNAEIILLHITELPASGSFNVEGEVETGDLWEDKVYKLKLIERAKQQLAEASAHAIGSGVQVRQELRLGNQVDPDRHGNFGTVEI
jgi:hypothetical protein